MSVFSENLRYIEPCEPEQTFESLANWYKYDFARPDPRPTWTFRTESVDVGGDLAVIVSRWMAVTDYGGFQAEVRRLRSIDFLRLVKTVGKFSAPSTTRCPAATRQGLRGQPARPHPGRRSSTLS
jgi:hypothetical protein